MTVSGLILSLCRMALGRLGSLPFTDSSHSPPNFGLAAQKSPLKVALRSLGPTFCATMVRGLFWAFLVALCVRLRSQFLGILGSAFLHACLPP